MGWIWDVVGHFEGFILSIPGAQYGMTQFDNG